MRSVSVVGLVSVRVRSHRAPKLRGRRGRTCCWPRCRTRGSSYRSAIPRDIRTLIEHGTRRSATTDVRDTRAGSGRITVERSGNHMTPPNLTHIDAKRRAALLAVADYAVEI